MSIIERITALLAPDNCLHCHREGSLLCRGCQTSLPALPGRCFKCYRRLSVGVVCADCCRATGLSSIQAVAHYDGIGSALVLRLKRDGNRSAAGIMAECMTRVLTDDLPCGLLVNIPATTSHLRQRGFDQAALIARHISRRLGMPQASLLGRLGKAHQLGSTRRQRLVQLKDTVYVKAPRAVRGANVLLVDDVLTTGSSLQAAATALLRAGAARVDAIVFAQAIKKEPT